jgi:hypothetical protein
MLPSGIFGERAVPLVPKVRSTVPVEVPAPAGGMPDDARRSTANTPVHNERARAREDDLIDDLPLCMPHRVRGAPKRCLEPKDFSRPSVATCRIEDVLDVA